VHTTAVLPGGQVITSVAYGCSRSRNGTRILLAFETRSGQHGYTAAEVQYFVCVWQAAPAVAVNDSDAGPSSAGSAVGAAAICMAVILCYRTSQPHEDPDLATILLEAKDGDWEQDSVGAVRQCAVPLDHLPTAHPRAPPRPGSGAVIICPRDGPVPAHCLPRQ
jgi:hypothetical protein